MAFIGNDPVWFITGCSTGFGRELASIVLDQGGRAVVTAPPPTKVQDLAGAHAGRALALPLDVNDAAARKAAVEHAQRAFGAIDVLVNNAGYGYLAAIEEGDEEAFRAMFETNLFGLIGMIQDVLPGMRARKQGHIVNISSIGGLCGFPGSGFYAGTKFAVEGVSEALAAEVNPLGIGVTIVEPGPFRTDWAGRSLQVAKRDIADYAATAGARRKQIGGYSGSQPGDPVRAAKTIMAAIHAPEPPLRLLLGAMAFETAQKKLASMKQNFDRWEDASRSADFPQVKAAE
jgi:NAD(P)-dependent dehydrogenase (short-subunit alcohol dehydrogenase family)